ncbi:MAG: hypothetical protein JW776_15015 [Candidatus Lokiarchaeota archaeon]|nr:hypothetical protein [Candidatus Lokiarchaeota archaeon]
MSNASEPQETTSLKSKYNLAEPHDLSPRSKWLRDYYFRGLDREWNNEYDPYSTGVEWDRIWAELDFYIVPEAMGFMGKKKRGPFGSSIDLMGKPVKLPKIFWEKSLPERRMIFFEEAMVNNTPQEIVGPSLLAGSRFNLQLSKCFTQKEEEEFNKKLVKDIRPSVWKFHEYGFGNLGATGGHLIPDFPTIINKGFKYVHKLAQDKYNELSDREKRGAKGEEVRAMIHATLIPKKLAEKYAEECRRVAEETEDLERKGELEQMAKNLEIVPWEPAQTFWQAVQSLWMAHMLIMAEESYPGPGDSFGRIDEYLYPYYKKDVLEKDLITKEFAKDILGSFWFHCNTAYDGQMRVGGNQGITAGFGQLLTLSGCGPNGEDLSNELTYTMLEVIDEWSPILEPKPNVRLHRNTPDELLDTLVDMITRSQGAPFILNFDERSIEGMVLEGIPKEDAWDYACVGCLENTMQGNDRSGTVNCNPNLAKSVELTLWNGASKFFKGKPEKNLIQFGPKTGNPEEFATWEEFWNAWEQQIKHIIQYTVEVYNKTENLRAAFLPTPYLSTLVRGCVEQGLDIRNGGPEIRFITIEGVGFATLVDSLLAIKHFVYDEQKFTIAELKEALVNNFQGKREYIIMQTTLKNRGPKFGNDLDEADELARNIMETWSSETFKYKTDTDFQFRGGMLSWNYWAGEDAAYTPATPNGRLANTFLSNAICPTNGADINGPTSVTNSVGNALGGKTDDGKYVNYLPNGASHTITFNPSMLREPESKEKFKAYLRGYIENGGTALQINILDANMLIDAQKHPENYPHLLVRVTGYNTYFVAIGRELQDEIIKREMHNF